MPSKQGYQYIMAHIHLFLFRRGIIDHFSTILVFLS
jgi:hypothetical protein